MYDHFLMQQLLLFYISTKIYVGWEKNLFPTPNFPSKKQLVGRTFQIAQNSWRAGMSAQEGWWVEHTSGTPHFCSSPCLIQRAASKHFFFFNFSLIVSLSEFWSFGPKEEKLRELEEQQIPDSSEWIFSETSSLQTSPVYEWITVKLKDEHKTNS